MPLSPPTSTLRRVSLLHRRMWSENSTWMSSISGPRSCQRLAIGSPRSSLWPRGPLLCQMKRARRTNRIPASVPGTSEALPFLEPQALPEARAFYLCFPSLAVPRWGRVSLLTFKRHPGWWQVPSRKAPLLRPAVSLEGGKDLAWWREKSYPPSWASASTAVCCLTSPSGSGLIPHGGATQPT